MGPSGRKVVFSATECTFRASPSANPVGLEEGTAKP